MLVFVCARARKCVCVCVFVCVRACVRVRECVRAYVGDGVRDPTRIAGHSVCKRGSESA